MDMYIKRVAKSGVVITQHIVHDAQKFFQSESDRELKERRDAKEKDKQRDDIQISVATAAEYRALYWAKR